MKSRKILSIACRPVQPHLGAILLAAALCAPPVFASSEEDILVLRNTTLNLIDALVQRGILDRASADAMIKAAQDKAAVDARNEVAAAGAGNGSSTKAAAVGATAGAGAENNGKTLHVTYIPEPVKDELRKEVGQGLRDDVVRDVKSQAKEEQWGVPAALPEWVNRFTLSGELRLRAEGDSYGSDNEEFSYLNWPAINKAGGVTAAGKNAFLNTTDSRTRFRERVALGFDVKITDGLTSGIRITTSNDRNPISTNQTLGQTGQQYEIVLDRAFLKYDYFDAHGYDWFTLWGGRIENPWFSTDNLFDGDLSFEGFAGTARYAVGDVHGGAITAGSSAANWGFTQGRSAFLTVGAFPLQEFEQTPHDKWLLGAQTGLDWLFANDSRLKFGLAYYDFINVAAQPNDYGNRDNDYSAPQFFTKGNSIARISNDVGETQANPRLVGLAADFNIADFTLSYDLATFAPYHLIFTGDYSRNIGFDQQEILRRTGIDYAERTSAYQLRVDFGYPKVRQFNDWNVFLLYKSLQRDAVLDAFTDSDFHLGGTDAKGWSIGANYGLAKNTWLTAKWTTTEAIDGPPLSIDVLLLDLTARF